MICREWKKGVFTEIEVEETEVGETERELTDSERIAVLEKRQDIAEAALEELIFVMMEGE